MGTSEIIVAVLGILDFLSQESYKQGRRLPTELLAQRTALRKELAARAGKPDKR